MNQEQQLNQLLVKNEDWIIAQILLSAKQYEPEQYISLINHSWRNTVTSFSVILSTLYAKLLKKNNCNLLNEIDEPVFLDYASSEVLRCRERNIESHIYLSFLKIIRTVYVELFTDQNINGKDNKHFFNFIEKCFNCIEVSFVKAWNTKTNEINPETWISDDNYLNLVFNNVPIPLLIVDNFQKIIKYNKSAQQFFPFLFKDKLNLQFGHSVAIKEKHTLISKIDEFRFSQHNESNFETSLNTYGGRFHALVGLRKIEGSENILVSLVDLTQWKNLQSRMEKSVAKAEESNRLKTVFLANMSHEIRTPMNAILGFSELLSLAKASPEEKDEYLYFIKKSSNDLLNIIEDVIDIAKIESKQLKIKQKPTQPSEIMNDIAVIYTDVLRRSGSSEVDIVINIPEKERNIELHTDPKRLKQVLSNLVGNAVKFTEKGTIEIGYKVAEKKLIYFYVKDTGTGIEKEAQKRIFNQFVQADNHYTKRSHGTGLGLSISKNIINLLGGDIWVSSVVGKGSNFYFYLPYIQPKIKNKIYKHQRKVKDTFLNLASITILIAEDEDSSYSYLKETLKDSGINLLRAKTGSEAISMTEANDSIDLILMDIKMPEINGIDATKYIKHIKPDLPVIAQTAFAMDNDKEACLEAGCSAFITKPINSIHLLSIINKHTSKQKRSVVS
jgi:signal transduction histidine kinase/CheY-like chemotaxis protein